MDPFTAILGTIDLAKKLYELAKAKKDAEGAMIAADLKMQLAEVKAKMAELIEDNTRLKDELKKATNTVPEVAIKDKLYYKTSDGDGPFCTTCYDDRKKLIRVTTVGDHLVRVTRCGVCKTAYDI